MKRILHFAYLLALPGLAGLLFAFSSSPRANGNPTEVQHRIILENCMEHQLSAEGSGRIRPASASAFSQGKFNLNRYPDSTLVFKGPVQEHMGEQMPAHSNYLIRRLGSTYNGSAGFLEKYLRSIWGVKTMGPEFVTVFKQEFGVSPLARVVPTADGKQWNHWSGPAVQLAFTKYYGKPGSPFQQSTYQHIYDLSAKSYASQYVDLLNLLLVTKRKQWDTLCRQYAIDARTKPKFDGSMASYIAADSLLSKTERERFPDMQEHTYVPVGELMRRQCDGSLPALITCFRTILRDYDPAALRRLQVQRPAPAKAARQ